MILVISMVKIFRSRSDRRRAGHSPTRSRGPLVSRRVDLIVAVQTPAAHAAKIDPRHSHRRDGRRSNRDGANHQPSRPDGNLTGVSATAAEAAANNFELITEINRGRVASAFWAMPTTRS